MCRLHAKPPCSKVGEKSQFPRQPRSPAPHLGRDLTRLPPPCMLAEHRRSLSSAFESTDGPTETALTSAFQMGLDRNVVIRACTWLVARHPTSAWPKSPAVS